MQEIFNTIYTHLLTQNARSGIVDSERIGKFFCMYRDPNGLKCAAGILIPDEEYDKKIEEGGPVDVNPYFKRKYSESELNLIDVCQSVHDYDEVESWKEKLNHVANKFGLEIPKL